MDRWIRRSLERAFWDRVFVGNAARPRDVAALIASIKPKTAIPLRRFGPRGDGGYLMPDDLEGITACISPGVSSECGFDEEIANLGIDVLMADASVAGPPKQHPRFHFFRKFVDIAATPTAMTMDDLAAETPAGDLLLQMAKAHTPPPCGARAPEQLRRPGPPCIAERASGDGIHLLPQGPRGGVAAAGAVISARA